jgi:hypothetical protein
VNPEDLKSGISDFRFPDFKSKTPAPPHARSIEIAIIIGLNHEDGSAGPEPEKT